MSEIYPHAHGSCPREMMHDGALASDVHKAAADIFAKRFHARPLTGHSIGMTMIEYPAIGANTQVELKENMVSQLSSSSRRSRRPGLPLYPRYVSRRQE